MSNLTLITTETFNNLPCNFYRNMNDDILLTREQIGQALEYSNPQKAIDNIHSKHRDRLDELSVTTKVQCKDKKYYNSCLYTLEGALIICSLSQQERAYDFSQWLLHLSNLNQNIKVIKSRKETEFIKLLTDFLDECQIKYIKQYQFENYRIDLYLPDLLIAIEYDEVEQHKYYTYLQQEFREETLKEKLKCNFIRLSDKDSYGKNLAKIIKYLNLFN